MGAALALISAPVFWLGLDSLFLFADDIGKFPILPGAGLLRRLTPRSLSRWFASLILPWLVLAAARRRSTRGYCGAA